MRDNLNNFSAHIRTNTKISKECFDTTSCSVTSLSGCNGPILSANERFLYLFIPKLEVNKIEKESKLSFIDIINEISKFGFECTIIESDCKNSYKYYNSSISINDSIIIELDLGNYNNSRHRYYAFCMYRHFYYCQNTLINYLKIIEENDTESVRIKKLSWAVGAAYNGGFTFLPSFIVNDYTIEYILNKFDTLTNSINNMGIFPTEELNDYATDLKKYTEEYQIYKDIADLKYKFISIENIDMKKYNNIFSDIIISEHISNINICSGRWEKYIAIKDSKKLDKYYIKRTACTTTCNSYLTVDNKTIYNSEGLLLSNSVAIKNCYYFDIDNYIKDMDTRKAVTVDIRSRHPSHAIFRNAIKSKKITLIRLGSITPTSKKYDLVINNEEAIRNSSSKLLMKRCFNKFGVITPEYVYADTIENVVLQLNNSNISFPIIAKNIMGSRGTGNYKIDNVEELNRWARNRTITNYIFEKFKNFAKEYRIHVSTEGVFLMWRKLRRVDTPDNQKWFFNNVNCNWISESNSLFDVPMNIKNIQNECIKALNSVGLDFGACDVRVQSNLTKEGLIRKNAPEFSIIEINSAPSMSPVTTEAYFKEFVKLIDKK